MSHPGLKSLLLLAWGCLGISALAQTNEGLNVHTERLLRPSRYAGTFFGASQHILGSSEDRLVGGVSLGYGEPERQFRFRNLHAQWVWEGYLLQTDYIGNHPSAPETTYGFGVLSYARYYFKTPSTVMVYVDLGWGLQYRDKTSLDLDTRINSTPVIGMGVVVNLFDQDWLVGLRLLHTSNGGTNPPNTGENLLLLTIGARF